MRALGWPLGEGATFGRGRNRARRGDQARLNSGRLGREQGLSPSAVSASSSPSFAPSGRLNKRVGVDRERPRALQAPPPAPAHRRTSAAAASAACAASAAARRSSFGCAVSLSGESLLPRTDAFDAVESALEASARPRALLGGHQAGSGRTLRRRGPPSFARRSAASFTAASKSTCLQSPSATGSIGLDIRRIPVGLVADRLDGLLGGAQQLGDLAVRQLRMIAHQPGDRRRAVLPLGQRRVARRLLLRLRARRRCAS